MQRLHAELKLPVYVLVDNDPWGFYIYSVVKQGSINLAFESMRMAVPDARFIGLSSFDKVTYKLPSNVAIKMDDGDVARATGTSTTFGAFLDSTLDRVADGAIFGGVVLGLAASGDPVSAATIPACRLPSGSR